MTGLILRRFLQLPIVLLAIFTLALSLAWAIPGNPLENPEGRRPPPEVERAMKAQYNLDGFWSFYGSYLAGVSGVAYARDALSGELRRERDAAQALGQAPARRFVFDLGPSLQYRDQRVNDVLAGSLPVSMALGLCAIGIALVLGVGAGVAGALRPRSLMDTLTLSVALVGVSLPSFVVGTIMLTVGGIWLGWFEVGSWRPPGSMVLPAFTLSLPFAAYIARLTRMGMIEQLSSDYVRTARAKGVSEPRVVLVHALRNAFLPVLSYLGPATALAMTGSFVVEVVFSVPGMGQHFVNAVQNKDLFLILGVVLVFSTILVLMNLAVDVLIRVLDPRAA
ncbi:MAG TPA: ABC transporter permease [Phycisphaerales bacterium]|nr:ABC transporter permease [Phycisphaerales bacterium]